MAPIDGYGIRPGVEPPKGARLVRFRSNVSHGGVNYGPSYETSVAALPEAVARQYVRQERAVYVEAPPAPVQDPAEPSATEDAGTATEEATEPVAEDDAEPEEGDAAEIPLPSDVPGFAALAAAGILTVEQLRAVDDLTSVDGIGASRANQIREWLG